MEMLFRNPNNVFSFFCLLEPKDYQRLHPK
jgi:hypothetical protein